MKIMNENSVTDSNIHSASAKLKTKKLGKIGGSSSLFNFGSLLQGVEKKVDIAGAKPLPDVISQVMAAADPARKKNAEISLNISPSSKAMPNAKKPTDPMIALEGNLLGRFVDTMLPKGKASIYGEGLAGDTWRGFAVDQMASALARSDPLGLAIKPYASLEPDSANSEAVSNLYGGSNIERPTSVNITPFASKAKT